MALVKYFYPCYRHIFSETAICRGRLISWPSGAEMMVLLLNDYYALTSVVSAVRVES